MTKLKGHGGFSLIELLWALLITGLLVAAGYPFYTAARADFRLQQSARLMAGRIREVQALSWNDDSRTYALLFSTADNSYLVVKSGERGYAVRYRLPAGVKLAGENFNGHQLTFYPDAANVTGGTIYLRDLLSGRNLFVIVLPVTGRVRISEKPPN